MSLVKQIAEFLFWLLILVFFAFGVAAFCATIYIVTYFLQAFIADIAPLNEMLLQGVQLPHICAKKMLDIVLSRTPA